MSNTVTVQLDPPLEAVLTLAPGPLVDVILGALPAALREPAQAYRDKAVDLARTKLRDVVAEVLHPRVDIEATGPVAPTATITD